MKLKAAAAFLLAALPAGAQAPAPSAQVRVTARIVVVDREAATRAGLGYVVLGNDRVRIGSGSRGRDGVEVDVLGARAFLELARDRRLIRSESTQQVLVMSGAEGYVASSELSVGRRTARTRGPSLVVVPTVREDGLVQLRVSARMEDEVRHGWGYGVDGSPAAVDTEILARPGEDVIIGSSTVSETVSETGLLRWGSASEERDVLVVVRAEVVGA